MVSWYLFNFSRLHSFFNLFDYGRLGLNRYRLRLRDKCLQIAKNWLEYVVSKSDKGANVEICVLIVISTYIQRE